jgi:regulator of protease activity HflC (stomatin/prohibitin superfamily)
MNKLVVSFLLDDVLMGLFISVPPGHVACVYDRGRGVLKKVWKPGLHLKIPFWQKAKLFNVQTLEYEIKKGFDLSDPAVMGDEAIQAREADGDDVQIQGTILFRMDENEVPRVWQEIGEDYVEKIIRPITRSRIRLIASRHEALDIGGKGRGQIEDEIKGELTKSFKEKGIIIEDVLLSHVSTARQAR